VQALRFDNPIEWLGSSWRPVMPGTKSGRRRRLEVAALRQNVPSSCASPPIASSAGLAAGMNARKQAKFLPSMLTTKRLDMHGNDLTTKFQTNGFTRLVAAHRRQP
jgi:hypothetical protein